MQSTGREQSIRQYVNTSIQQYSNTRIVYSRTWTYRMAQAHSPNASQSGLLSPLTPPFCPATPPAAWGHCQFFSDSLCANSLVLHLLALFCFLSTLPVSYLSLFLLPCLSLYFSLLSPVSCLLSLCGSIGPLPDLIPGLGPTTTATTTAPPTAVFSLALRNHRIVCSNCNPRCCPFLLSCTYCSCVPSACAVYRPPRSIIAIPPRRLPYHWSLLNPAVSHL
jgi:hypothetical protein